MLPTAIGEALDMRGKTITTFILYQAHRTLQDMTVGDTLEIATDPFVPIKNDIEAWSRMTCHRLLEFRDKGDKYCFLIEKGHEERYYQKKLALVISDDGLEELLSPLGFALGAALIGKQVFIYFQGPAVRVLTEGFKEKLHGLNRPFSRFARNGLHAVGHIPPQQKLQQLAELGAQFVACGPSMQHFKVAQEDFIFDNVMIGEYVTFMEIMDTAEIRFFLQ